MDTLRVLVEWLFYRPSYTRILVAAAAELLAVLVVLVDDRNIEFPVHWAHTALNLTLSSFSTGLLAVTVAVVEWALRNIQNFRRGLRVRQLLRAFGFAGIAWTAAFL